jgi:hypothetical protein
MGWLLEHFGARMLHRGVEDSLARLKHVAEALHAERDSSFTQNYKIGMMKVWEGDEW